MQKADIKNRNDIYKLVTTFYAKVQKDELLGPIFTSVVDDWEGHFEKLTDFWESNLFFKKSYQGTPLQKHVEVDTKFDYTINELHFGVWLNIWFATVDDLFDGELAMRAKNRARNMGTFIHLKIFEARQ